MSDIPTTERLARALEAENAACHNPQLWPMIKRAREGYYDDYKSPLDTPCIQLVNDLKAAGAGILAKRAMDGEFDATKEESDAWAASPDGQAAFRELLGGSS